jgi:hypothetical protein
MPQFARLLRQNRGKPSTTNLSDVMWVAIGSDNCKLELNWLYFLFGDSIYIIVARGGVSGCGDFLMNLNVINMN